MKILFIAPLPLPITGQSLACELFRKALVEDGHQVNVVNLSNGNLKHDASIIKRVFDIAKILLQVLMKRHGSDLVYFNTSESVLGNLKDLLVFILLTGKLDVTYTHLHGGAGMRVLLSGRYPSLRKLNSFFLRRVAGAVVLGERHTSIFHGLMDPTRIHIVENFAPDELFASDEVLERKLARKERVRVLYLSNLLPGKGYKDLVKAIDLIGPEVRSQLLFDFAGGFESESAKEEFMHSVASFDGVTYHGSVQGLEKTALLEQADIFCLPTYYPYEGQPISILEAYANGCTVLTTDHSGIFDIFTPEVNGIAVEKQSPASIAKALEQLVQNRDLLRRYGLANARLARDRFKPRQHLARLKQRLSLIAA